VYKKQLGIVGHAGAVYTSAFDQLFAYTGSADRFVTRWDLTSGLQDKFAIKMDHSIYKIEFIAPELLIVALSNGAFHIFDVSARIELKHFKQHIHPIFSVAVNSVKSHFYLGDSDGNFSVWNNESFELLLFLPLSCGKIRDISVSKDGAHILLSCQDGTTRVFDSIGFNEIHTIETHKEGATIAKFHELFHDLILTGGKDAHLKIWNWKTEELIKNIPAHNYVIYSILFMNQGNEFVTGSRDKTIKIWDSSSYTVKQRLDTKVGGHKHSVNSLTKTSESSFVSTSDDKTLISWKFEEYEK
jgi:WD40 repeat protein